MVSSDDTEHTRSTKLSLKQRDIAILKKQAFDRRQADGSLAQVSTLKSLSLIPPEVQRDSTSFCSRSRTRALL